MKKGILKLLLLAISLISLMAQAQMQPVAATFDSGEPEPAGVGAKLQSSSLLKDDVAIPGSARSAALVTAVEAPSDAPSASVAAPKAPERMNLDTQAQWKIQTGERISDVFTRWARVVGWQLTWEPTDMIALADLELEDSFTGAVTKVIDALNRGEGDIQAKFYASNHMLRIMARK